MSVGSAGWTSARADDIASSDPRTDWELLKAIGRGSYGQVFAARKRQRPVADAPVEIVAVKQISLEAADGEVDDLTNEVQREVETLRMCSHVAILRYLGAYVHEQTLWLVTELCEAGSLLDIMRRRGAPLDEASLRAVLMCALCALRYLHESLCITHRDVKAANLLLTAAGQVKLADFGVSVQRARCSAFQPASHEVAYAAACTKSVDCARRPAESAVARDSLARSLFGPGCALDGYRHPTLE